MWQKGILANSFVLFLAILTFTDLGTGQDAKKWVVINNNIPENAVRFNIKLEFISSNQSFGQTSQEIKAEAITEGKKTKDFSKVINIGTAIDGHSYRILLGEASELDILNRDSDKMLKIEIQRWKQNEKPEVLKEGYVTVGRDIELPFEISSDQINLPASSKISGLFTIDIYNNGDQFPRGRFETKINGQLSGTTTMQTAKMNVLLTCGNSFKLEDRNIRLEIQPFDKNMQAISAHGKISDILTVSKGSIAIEKIMSDCSELVLALVQGDINNISEQPNSLIINKPVPNFARVELVQRKLLTLDDLKTQATAQGNIVLLFGEFKDDMGQGRMPGMMPPQMASTNFTFDESIMLKILREESKPLLAVFVCQRVPLENLYGKWLDQKLDFAIISDFDNPLNAISQGSCPHVFYGGRTPAQGTLRDFFGIAHNKVAAVVINGTGDLVYFNKDIGQKLSEVLSEINTLIRK